MKHNSKSETELELENKKLFRSICLVAASVFVISIGFQGINKFRTHLKENPRPPKPRPLLNKIPGFYTESEVDEIIKPGMKIKDVIAHFGAQYTKSDWEDGIKYSWETYEYLSEDYNLDFALSAFSVYVTNGTVVKWKPTCHVGSPNY